MRIVAVLPSTVTSSALYFGGYPRGQGLSPRFVIQRPISAALISGQALQKLELIRQHGRPFGFILTLVFKHHAYCTFPDFRGISFGSVHYSILSRNGASDKPGAIHYGFLESVVTAALAVNEPFLSQTVIKAINYHAIACLHSGAGEYRPCPVMVGKYQPPQHHRVNALMDDFVNKVNRNWHESDVLGLAAFVLWRLNHIHPFINGNGRTARATCYFVLCVKIGRWLPGQIIVPELLRQNRDRYIDALKQADKSVTGGNIDKLFAPLIQLLSEFLQKQFDSAQGT